MTKVLPITRANLAGKRRYAIYIDKLADYSEIPLSLLIEELKASKLRQHIDWAYNPNKESYALSLASAQAIIITSLVRAAEHSLAWQTWHAITDHIQGQTHETTTKVK